MNDKNVTQDDLEINRRITDLESDSKSGIRSYNRNFMLLAAILVGSTFFNYTELSKFKDSQTAFQISVSEKFAGMTANFAGMTANFTGLSEEVTGLSEEVTGLSEEVTGIKEEVTGLSEEVTGLSEEVTGLSEEVTGIKESFREELTKLDTRLMAQITELKDSVSDQLLDNNRTLGELIAKGDSLQSQAVN